MKRIIALIISLCFVLILFACGTTQEDETKSTNEDLGTQTTQQNNTFSIISAEAAFEMMNENEDYVILDVRTKAEYDSGHIEGALLLPNEEIGTDEIEILPDKDKLILVYCRSGNRSKQASQKLVDLGYTNVFEFGGIIDWPYETVVN